MKEIQLKFIQDNFIEQLSRFTHKSSQERKQISYEDL